MKERSSLGHRDDEIRSVVVLLFVFVAHHVAHHPRSLCVGDVWSGDRMMRVGLDLVYQ